MSFPQSEALPQCNAWEMRVPCSCCVLEAVPLVVVVIVANMIILLLCIQSSSAYFTYVKPFHLHSKVDTIINPILQMKRLRHRGGAYLAKDSQLVSKL